MLDAPVVRRRLVPSRTCARVAAFFTPSGPAGGGAASSGDGGGVDCFGRGETPVGGSQGAGSVDVIGLDWAEFVCGPGSWAWGRRAETNANSIAIS